MLKYAAKRARYELLRLLNRVRSGFRFAHAPVGGRYHVAYRAPDGRERVLDLRGGTTDLRVFTDLFAYGQLDLSRFQRSKDVERRYSAIIDSGKVPLIIDAGAYNGLSALYFRERYPEAGIIAIEPEAGNFAELEALMGRDPLCLCLQAAIANFDGHVEIEDPGLGEWGFRTRQSEKGVAAHRLSTLLTMAPWDVEPFILKVNIEGFERDLFDGPGALDLFYVAMIELHDWMLPGQGNSRKVIAALASLDRDFLLLGENIVSIKNGDG